MVSHQSLTQIRTIRGCPHDFKFSDYPNQIVHLPHIVRTCNRALSHCNIRSVQALLCVCYINHFLFFLWLFSHSSSVFIHLVFRNLDCVFRRAYAQSHVVIQEMFCWYFVSSFACCGSLVDILQLMEWYKRSCVNLTYIVSCAIQQVSHLYPQPLL